MTQRRAAFVVPGSINTRTGGSIYDRRMVEGLRRRGWDVDVIELGPGFPFPAPAAIREATASLGSIASKTLTIVDGLAMSVLPDAIEREASRLSVVALVHLPVAADVGLDGKTASRLEKAERRALAAVPLVIVTGKTTLEMLERYAGVREKAMVVEPGTDRARPATGSGGSTVQLLSVATLNAGKGHDVLLRSLGAMPHANWRLTCAGNYERDARTTNHVRHMIDELGLGDRVTLAGDLDAPVLAQCYDTADVFVLASRQETFGMAVAEALAHGLPVVSTMTGAIPDLVGPDAGILVPPGNTNDLTNALSRVVGDADLRARLAAGARRVAETLPTWDHAAARFASALESLAIHG